jgi:hypothetical protein
MALSDLNLVQLSQDVPSLHCPFCGSSVHDGDFMKDGSICLHHVFSIAEGELHFLKTGLMRTLGLSAESTKEMSSSDIEWPVSIRALPEINTKTLVNNAASLPDCLVYVIDNVFDRTYISFTADLCPFER